MQTNPTAAETLHADIVIVGGGLVGAVAARALADTGFRIVVIDGTDPRDARDAAFDGRASAVAAASERLLSAIGVWPHLEPEVAPILDIRVADGRSPLFLHYNHEDVDAGPLGYLAENRHIRMAALAALEDTDNVRFLAPLRVEHIERSASGVRATLSDGRTVKARLAIAADGRGSKIRESAGIKTTQWRYPQEAIVCTVEHATPHGFVAHEHFMPAGPFAILPLKGTAERPGCRSSIVWTERAARAKALVSLDDETFLNELAKRFGDFMGEIEVVGPRFCHPLGLQFAHASVAERLVLIGDADHGMHPIAGQGLNMGYRDVAALCDVLGEARRLGLDIGSGAVLQRYQRWRRFDNTLMLAVTDGLNRLFSNDIAPIRHARDIGLGLVDKMPPLKKVLMRSAMGLMGDLPTLMQR
ncbi:MAG: UbiH/UbiF/VisC/COQ6 family ubiquinone biosynthesis hydroxylase [Rhodospirillales bacterium]|nr:UbiH/UbiF/VisC/COQ6 family ubiquinone biosynthesis hydroxylase [Rhodospirillales bacterium]MBO6787656.1 UbiH/UbiF/VisC/COQ6 family ubiquinone biosynthesis hydroxylase [Rhodospirillales bacterium]